MRRFLVLILTLAVPAFASANTALRCSATAPAFAPAVIELFTSEGCDSCPPADRWLADIRDDGAIALAFHVTYWDALGWRDAFASRSFDARHNDRTFNGGGRTVYTPQVFVDGQEWRQWRTDAGARRIAEAARKRIASATMTLRWQIAGNGVDIEIAGRSSAADRAELNVALVEDGLASEVTRGENRGKRLRHEHVVRALGEAVTIAPKADFAHALHLDLPPTANTGKTRVIAWLAAETAYETLSAGSSPLICVPGAS